jgi:hypothetical protein
MRREHPRWGSRWIRLEMLRRPRPWTSGDLVVPSERTIDRILHRQGCYGPDRGNGLGSPISGLSGLGRCLRHANVTRNVPAKLGRRLVMIAICRMRIDEPTKSYVARKNLAASHRADLLRAPDPGLDAVRVLQRPQEGGCRVEADLHRADPGGGRVGAARVRRVQPRPEIPSDRRRLAERLAHQPTRGRTNPDHRTDENHSRGSVFTRGQGQFSAAADKVRANASPWEGRRCPATARTRRPPAVPNLALPTEVR